VSPPRAASYAGVAFFKALGELLGREITVDCGERAGDVLAALRIGCRKVVFRGDPARLARLQDIARQLGAVVTAAIEPPLLALGYGQDPPERFDPGPRAVR